jgi:PII-like signaling protein
VTPNTERVQALSVLRIYLRRRSTPAPGLLGRFFGGSLSNELATRALRAGVTYATVTLGHAGFVHGAKRVAADITDIPPTMLPTCVELVGRPETLDAFVEANAGDLADAVLLRLEGVAVSLDGTEA